MGQRANLMAVSGSSHMPSRKALATKAMQAAINARLVAGHDLVSPISIYDLAAKLGVRVTFNDINMEGMYQRGSPPRIHLSSLRPLVRRTYNCAHELGHHVLGHGSSIDELREEQEVRPWNVPNEFMADTFAGFALMPTLGLRHAFVARKIDPEKATASEIYRVACHFGVGYVTLITQLHYGVAMISRSRFAALQGVSPQSVRAHILGYAMSSPLIVIDELSGAPTIDGEVGHHLLLPSGTTASGDQLVQVADLPFGRLFEACRPGISQLTRPASEWAAFVRISRAAYVGRAEFRHLEDVPHD